MKKILFIGFSIGIVVFAFVSNIHAQQSTNAFAFNPGKSVTVKLFTTNFNSLKDFPLSEIRTKAIRHFTKSFKQAESVRWYNVKDGVMVYFTEKGINTRTGYDKKGNWLYNLRSYGEAYLPKDVRARVKSAFYDFSITGINEITNAKQIIYMVHIEDNACFKIIRVCEGGMEAVKEYVK